MERAQMTQGFERGNAHENKKGRYGGTYKSFVVHRPNCLIEHKVYGPYYRRVPRLLAGTGHLTHYPVTLDRLRDGYIPTTNSLLSQLTQPVMQLAEKGSVRRDD